MKHVIADLTEILHGNPWHIRPALEAYVRKLQSESTPRTAQQNKALHKFFDLLADALNDAGFTVQLVLKEKVDLDWDGTKVKELLWRPSQQVILGKKSTAALSKIEDIDKVYDHLSRHLAEKFSIHVPFPSYETPYDKAPLKTDP